MTSATPMERRVKISAVLVLLGLLIELIALRWSHPTAFLAFALIGIPCVAAGIIVFLYSLVSIKEE
jgi:hypothetical protein